MVDLAQEIHPGFEIRQINPDEWDTLRAAASLISEQLLEGRTVPAIVHNRMQEEGRRTLGAFVSGQLVGTANLDVQINEDGNAFLAWIVVDRTKRNRGLGEALLRSAEVTALEAGAQGLWLRAYPSSDASSKRSAASFFSHQGYANDTEDPSRYWHNLPR